MPSDPIEFRIVQNLQTALLAIAVASGYHYDVAAATVKLDPNQGVEALVAPDGPRPFLVIEVQPETWAYYPAGDVKLRMPLTVHWVSESTPTDDTSRMQTFFRGCADVEQAVAVDIGRGGLATDTRVVRRTFDTAVDGAQVWALVELEVLVHRTFGQPNG